VFVKAAEQAGFGRLGQDSGQGNSRHQREDTFHRSVISAIEVVKMPHRAKLELQKYWSLQPDP
jgi:hypothetical protein